MSDNDREQRHRAKNEQARNRLRDADRHRLDPTLSPLTAHAEALLALAHSVLVLADAIVANAARSVDGDGAR